MAELQARRRALLARCEAQRLDFSWRLAQLNQGPLRFLSSGAAALAARSGRHPLAWVAALAGVLLLGRVRRARSLLAWTRSALTVLARVTEVLGVLRLLRSRRQA